MQRIDPDGFGAKELCEYAAGREADIVAVGEDHFEIGVRLAVRQARHAVVHAARQFADFRMQRAAERGGFAVEPGDIALIRTGWGRYFGADNARYVEGEPGIDVPATKWLIDQGIVAIGADNMAVEVLPNPDKGIMMPVHQYALAECGVYLIENLALEELAAERIYAACFILLATKIRGAITSLNQLMITGGILVAFIINAILASSQNWRLMLGLAAVLALAFIPGSAPETDE